MGYLMQYSLFYFEFTFVPYTAGGEGHFPGIKAYKVPVFWENKYLYINPPIVAAGTGRVLYLFLNYCLT